jgi:hypothetical protein
MSYCFFFINKTQALAKSIANVNFSIILYFILYHIFFQKIKWICFLTDFNHTFTKMCRIFYDLYIIKHFRKCPFMSWMNYSSLSRLYINSWKKYSSFIQMDETWENGQFKKKDQHTSYTTKSTRGTVIILTKWYLPPTAFLKINLSLLGDVRTEYITSCLSKNDVLPWCNRHARIQCVCVCVWRGGVIWLRTPSLP